MSQLYAVIDPRSERYASWVAMLGRDYIPITPDPPCIALVREPDGSQREKLVYLVDLGAISLAVLGRIVDEMAARYTVKEEEILEALAEEGMPILAESVEVGTDHHEVRMRFPFWRKTEEARR